MTLQEALEETDKATLPDRGGWIVDSVLFIPVCWSADGEYRTALNHHELSRTDWISIK